ncbi:DUF3488 and transglutaminase-like domain-containing protein [Umezawaea sp.]|uniref:transglutaminase family protein n=1 Tax=Umezawaea sp. TaxID=1955258 RepID=UPI002ED329F7
MTPAVAALAVVCSATALSGVVTGGLWIFYVLIAVAVVSGTGLLLRAVRLPAPLVGIGQILALLCLLVTLFTRTGFLVVLPGPESLGDLWSVLGNSISEVQTGVPPVAESPAMRCLIMLAMGLVAVLVDTLAVGAAAPAASGLVLLCVFAVPASLADEMLPLWTFVLGAASFALLLVVDGQHRHEAWRGRMSGTGGSSSGGAATAVAGMAVVIALFAGATFTLIGTVGRLPGTGTAAGGGADGLGLKPLTELRGMLSQGETREMFHVRGLPDSAYLRAMTLQQYDPGSGEWSVGGALSEGSPARGDLPPQPGDPGDGKTTKVQIDPVGWNDVWLPVYGKPRKIENTDDTWRFDNARGMIYSLKKHKVGPYTLETVLENPSADELRRANGSAEGVDPVYFQINGIDQSITALARTVTQNESTKFDKATALYRYFTDGTQGFKYSTKTEGDSNADALVDFVINSKTGFCQQYSAAMAVMARSIGLPARVAIGFTGGYPTDDYKTITSLDAHAWVEIYFAGHGWMVFDPTPLTDGRGVIPSYIGGTGDDGQAQAPDEGDQSAAASSSAVPTTSSAAPVVDAQDLAGATPVETTPGWHWITLAVTGGLAALLTALLFLMPSVGALASFHRLPWARPAVAAAAAASWALTVALLIALFSWWLAVPLLLLAVAASPAAIRALRRHNRLQSIAGLGAQAANAAWEELIAESVDRGTRIPPTETVRVAARRMARAHNLDEQGRDGLRSVVGAVERSWYSGRADADPQLPQAVDDVRRSLSRNAPLALRARVLPRSVLQPTVPDEPED